MMLPPIINDANRLLDGSLLSDASSRRPIAIGLLGALLGLTGRNLQNATAILVFLEAVACIYMALEVRRSKGAAAGAVTFWIVFLFARRFIGTTMTETLGLTSGGAGTGFFLPGCIEKIAAIHSGRIVPANPGAQCTCRSILHPAASGAVGWVVVPGEELDLAWKPALLAVLVVVAGFGVNSLVLRLIGTPGGIPFGNFSESLYGLASGGERWSYVYDQYSEDPRSCRKKNALNRSTAWHLT